METDVTTLSIKNSTLVTPMLSDAIAETLVTPDNTVYVNTWSGVYYGNDKPPEGGFLIALKDTKGSGHADVNVRFGPTSAEGAHGGTGIWLYKDWLYAEINDKIVRYKLKDGQVEPPGQSETILSGIPITGDHPMHTFAIDEVGKLFVSMGSATNACEKENRMPHSSGNDPCTELDTRAGIWLYDANKTDQVFSPKERYASGIRNGEGFDFDTSRRLYVTQHGRDQLHEDWPELYTAEQGFELFRRERLVDGAPIHGAGGDGVFHDEAVFGGASGALARLGDERAVSGEHAFLAVHRERGKVFRLEVAAYPTAFQQLVQFAELRPG